MSTLVKFLKAPETEHNRAEIVAYFPQLNYNKDLYGNRMKTCYVHVGQHSSCSVDYIKFLEPATVEEYLPLKQELESIGYELKVIKQ